MSFQTLFWLNKEQTFCRAGSVSEVRHRDFIYFDFSASTTAERAMWWNSVLFVSLMLRSDYKMSAMCHIVYILFFSFAINRDIFLAVFPARGGNWLQKRYKIMSFNDELDLWWLLQTLFQLISWWSLPFPAVQIIDLPVSLTSRDQTTVWWVPLAHHLPRDTDTNLQLAVRELKFVGLKDVTLLLSLDVEIKIESLYCHCTKVYNEICSAASELSVRSPKIQTDRQQHNHSLKIKKIKNFKRTF